MASFFFAGETEVVIETIIRIIRVNWPARLWPLGVETQVGSGSGFPNASDGISRPYSMEQGCAQPSEATRMRQYIGIDVSEHELHVSWLCDPDQGGARTQMFKNQLSAFQPLKDWISFQTGVGPEDILIVLEIARNYPERLICYLRDQGFQLLLASPSQAESYAGSPGDACETGRSVSLMLARFGKEQDRIVFARAGADRASGKETRGSSEVESERSEKGQLARSQST